MIAEWSAADAAAQLRIPVETDDKYQRGVLGVRTGAAQFPGAAVLGVSAAWRTGVGMVRYVPPVDEGPAPYGLPSPAVAVLAARPETVIGPPPGRPCDAWLIGSGTDPALRSPAETHELRTLLAGSAPVVVDAGALDLVHEERGDDAPLILTPHGGEFERLWQASELGALPDGWDPRTPDSELRASLAGRLADALGATVLLKGSVTVVASPGGFRRRIGPATPWLASAGTGDVLAGILGALVASRAEEVGQDPELLAQLGATAALLHDSAARIASEGTRPITALDVAESTPAAFAALTAAVV
ncbi:ADP-dependent NAD(P)H-hydrate dehydratase [Leucobacter sp. USHLN153]|uniref:ADP-dependent NAD(P)H-hydrate dehydratase n=1 Tax=Leucobacter sp. USHLN153 TaxID=3081268 RepID=UPI003018C084